MKTTVQTSVRRQTRPRPVLRRRRAVSDDGAQGVVLYNVPWQLYVDLCDAQGERNIRMTYDRGTLEIMPIPEHESDNFLARRLIETLSEELDLDIAGLGSTTYRKEAAKRALEADESYYLANSARIKGKKRLDLDHDPPPDLVLEIDVTHSSVDRLAIYAALRVPEVWRVKGGVFFLYSLTAENVYVEIDRSATFPLVSVEDLNRSLAVGREQGANRMLQAFRAWLQDKMKKPRRKKNGND